MLGPYDIRRPSSTSDRSCPIVGIDRSAAGYSAGMKQKARIAYAMIHTPRLLLLDEPMTALDVLFQLAWPSPHALILSKTTSRAVGSRVAFSISSPRSQPGTSKGCGRWP